MSPETRTIAGVTLLTVPSIQYGGYFLLKSLMDRGSAYMDNPLRQNFFGGSCLCRRFRASVAGLPDVGGLGHFAAGTSLAGKARSPCLRDLPALGILCLGRSAKRHRTQSRGVVDLFRPLLLAVSVMTLGVLLLRTA
jgi:hypothetical protein